MRRYLGGFFIFVLVASVFPRAIFADAGATVAITEIGAYELTNAEWIEIFNYGSIPVDLNGWVFWENETNHRLNLAQGDDFILEADEYAVIADVASTTLEQYALAGITVFDSAWATLKESGEEIGLKDGTGTFVELFTYLAAPLASLERVSATAADYTESNWQERGSGNSLGRANDASTPQTQAGGEEADEDAAASSTPAAPTAGEAVSSTPAASADEADAVPVSQDDGGGHPAILHYSAGVVIINELVSDPADTEEWVELYNNSTMRVDFTGWVLEDGTETPTPLSGELMPHEFFVIEKPKGRLNNGGDYVLLKDGTGAPIDRVTYGKWDDGNVHDNAPVAKDPYSLARIQDGADSNNDLLDFAVTETPTKGTPNVITNADTRARVPSSSYADERTYGSLPAADFGTGLVRINEFLPNPVGTDAADEFIELYNFSSSTADLSGWGVRDALGKTFRIERVTLLEPRAFLTLYRSTTAIALNNTGGETVELLDAFGAVADSAAFEGAAREGYSFARAKTGGWRWTARPTPGAENVFLQENRAPIAVIDADREIAVDDEILFDASDSTDMENDPLTFHWDFGDGEESTKRSVRHAFEKPGAYTVVLTVFDGELESRTSLTVVVYSASALAIDGIGGPAVVDYSLLRITEFMPDPAGSDDAEWIELHNAGDVPFSLEGVKLDDEDGGSRGYTMSDPLMLDPGQFAVFGRQQTRIALNNTGDSARLLDPYDVLLQQVVYDDAQEDMSFAVDERGSWQWTTTPTPGADNVITVPAPRAGTARRSAVRGGGPLRHVELASLRTMDAGDRVAVSGIVSVLPGIFGSQYFYIRNASSTAGVQVYSFKKDFPPLVVGNRIAVTGELSVVQDEMRVKTKTAADIAVEGMEADAVPERTAIGQLGEEYEGALVRVAGEVTKRLSNKAYVDDGTEELLVYIKEGAGIGPSQLREGEMAEVTGVFSQTKSGYRLLPRRIEDIVMLSERLADTRQRVVVKSSAASAASSFLAAAAGTLSSFLVVLLAKSHFDGFMNFTVRVWHRLRRRDDWFSG